MPKTRLVYSYDPRVDSKDKTTDQDIRSELRRSRTGSQKFFARQDQEEGYDELMEWLNSKKEATND